jgi:hypothetical protein
MRDKAHDDLAVTVTTDPSETTTCALNHDAETAAQVLLRIRSGCHDRPDAAMGMARSAVRSLGGATPRLGRRRAIALAGGGVAALGFGKHAAATAPTDLQLNVFRQGSPIGTHVIRFSQAGGTLQVASEVDLRVKVAFITAYSYRQTSNDDWEDEVLVRSRIQTDDDGKDTSVEAEARDGQLAVQGPAGSYTTPLGAMTDISFWNEAITRGPALVDSQSAELIKIQVEAATRERIEVRGQPVDARRFAMTGTKGRSGTVWYDDAGSLVKAVVITRGETLGYEL